MPYLAYEPSSVFVPSYVHILVFSSSGDDNKDENTPLPSHLPKYYSIEHEPATTASQMGLFNLRSRW
jgi:hypothetical protein